MRKDSKKIKSIFIGMMSIILLLTATMPAWADKLQNEVGSSSVTIPQTVQFEDSDQIGEEQNNQDNNGEIITNEDERREWMNTINEESLQIEQIDNKEEIKQPIEENVTRISQSFPTSVEKNTVVTSPVNSDSLSELKERSIEKRKNRLFQTDRFNYQQKDVEELLLSGYTLEDIYLSDQLGNEWLVNPKELLLQKKAGKDSWDGIESKLKKKVENELGLLQKKQKDKASEINSITSNLAERVTLLQQLDSDTTATLGEVVDAYRTNGVNGLQKLKQQHERGNQHE